GSPDVTRALADLLETFSTRHLWLELINDRLVFPDDHLRQRRRINFITRPRKLPRNQVSLTLLQVRRHLRRLQRLKHLRRARNFSKQLLIARRRISHAVTSARIGREYPEHRAARTRARISFKKRAVPLELRSTVKTFDAHSKLTEHERLAQRIRSGSTILDKLSQRFRRIDKAVVIVARVTVYVAIIDRRDCMIRKPLAALG